MTIHQVEITSECNLRCVYCLHPTMTRPKAHMTRETWGATTRWIRACVDAGTQGELLLVGTGEPTLHPALLAIVQEARALLGPSRRIQLTTNGIAVTDAQIAGLAAAGVRCYVSLHRPEKAEGTVHRLQDAGILEAVVYDAVVGANSWAGQVAWPDRVIQPGREKPVCPWLTRGWLFVASDGTFYDCCYANGDSPRRGSVLDEPHPITAQPWHACAACWQRPPASPREMSPELRR